MRKWVKDLAPNSKMIAEILWIADVLYGLFNAALTVAMVMGFFSPRLLDNLDVGPIHLVTDGVPIEWYQMLLLFGVSLSIWLFIHTLHKFYKRVCEGEIFTDLNVKALNLMTVASFLAVVLADVNNYVVSKILMHQLPHGGKPLDLTYHISWVYLFMALLIFVFANIFKKAVAAVKETEETI